MKNLAIALALIFAPAALYAQLYVEPEQDVECSVFIQKQGRGRAQQGMEMWGNYIFSLEDGGHVNVYDFDRADGVVIGQFDLATSRSDNHANNASFGVETRKGASFPLLYITNGKVGSEIEWTCFVESITRKGRKFSSELVQSIVLDGSGWEDLGYAAIFGAPSWMVDRERGCLWVFSARKRTVAKVTKYAWENQYIATKFRIPALSEGPLVRLGANDILDQVVFPYEVWFTQAGCVHDGKIYYCFGVGRYDDKRPSRVRVYDTDTRTITARYELQNQIIYEPEDIVVRNGWMYVNTNTNPKRTQEPPCIYRLSLPKPRPVPSSPVEELLQDPERAAGIYYVTGLSSPVTPAPAGYKPFYINGYFRHGARHIDDYETVSLVYGELEAACSQDNLTEFGQALYARLAPFKKNILYRTGDLTQLGYSQALGIGRRMADNYPEVFDGVPFLKTNSTNVLRVAATMQAVNEGIMSVYPGLVWKEVDNSRSFLPQLNPYGTVCPGRSDIDARILSADAAWNRTYDAFLDSNFSDDAVLGRIFKDVSMIGAAHRNLVRRFWLLASDMQCLDRQVPVWDIFTADEIVTMTIAENYRYFAVKGPEPQSFGRGWQLGSRTLRHLLEESRADILAGRHGIDLNFGHDGTLMAIMTNLGAGTWGREASDAADALNSWQYWNIPMGTNLQMVFYRNESCPGKVLVKFMLNEKDLRLPLDGVEGPYYDWDTLYEYYIGRCDDAEEALEQSSSYDINLF